MKSIIIIITLFLATHTAKADWVKSGELDSLYLGDAPITFSKYSPDYTKFVTYSAQDSTLRLWDLGTGKVIKERTFEWSYNYNFCEFDFINYMFYMVNNGGYLYPNSYIKSVPFKQSNRLWFINFTDKLNSINVVTDYSTIRSYPFNFTNYMEIYRCMNITMNKNGISLNYRLEQVNLDASTNKGYSDNFIQSAFVNRFKDSIKLSNLKKVNINYYATLNENCFMSNKKNYHSNINILFNDTIYDYSSFETKINSANYPVANKAINPLDINYNTLVYSDTNGIVKFFSRKEEMNIDLGIPHNSNSIMSIKLINSIRYSIYYLKNKYFVLSDNQEKKILDTISLPFGNVGYSERDSMVYSEKSNTIYRRGLVFEKNEVDYIYINKTSYLNTDTIVLKKNYNQSDSNLIWTIDGKIYTEVSPKVVISSPGYYNVKLEFLRNGKQYLIERDSFIIVYDPTDIQDFTERKYIFKQDAEGIYCQLEGEGEVSLYDNVGRWVRTYQIVNERYIRKEDIERGVYFLSIQTNGNVYHEKVLVE